MYAIRLLYRWGWYFSICGRKQRVESKVPNHDFQGHKWESVGRCWQFPSLRPGWLWPPAYVASNQTKWLVCLECEAVHCSTSMCCMQSYMLIPIFLRYIFVIWMHLPLHKKTGNKCRDFRKGTLGLNMYSWLDPASPFLLPIRNIAGSIIPSKGPFCNWVKYARL